ncbi:MAG TPA: porin [Chryseosolibacter sp.]
MKIAKKIIFLIAITASIVTNAQVKPAPLPYFTFGKGIGLTAPDSTFSMAIRFRVQNRVAFKTVSDTDFGISEVEARVRRLRLRFDGFVYDPRLVYVLQLSFTRSDMDFETTQFPNIIRDAYIQYSISKNVTVGVGQTKLPGNRQRVVSSGDQQFADRSIANGAFTLDRDFGVQLAVKQPMYTFRAAISSGEGRNITTSDNGLAYTGRVELLPFGAFTNGGDYFEGDLAREQKPKLSIGLAYNLNEKAVRTGGQLGVPLYEGRTIETQIVDAVFKYSGLAISGEYFNRFAKDPITTNEEGEERHVYSGIGQNYQVSYNFKNNVELATRYTVISPRQVIAHKEKLKENYTLGVNKYLKGHRVKLQGDVTLERAARFGTEATQTWAVRFQIEAGI